MQIHYEQKQSILLNISANNSIRVQLNLFIALELWIMITKLPQKLQHEQ